MIDKEIFAKAADIIEERGWHKGSPAGLGGSVCAAEAIRVALGVGGLVEAFDNSWGKLVGFHDWFGRQWAKKTKKAFKPNAFGAGHFGIGAWNDEKGRTKEKVVDFLRYLAR